MPGHSAKNQLLLEYLVFHVNLPQWREWMVFKKSKNSRPTKKYRSAVLFVTVVKHQVALGLFFSVLILEKLKFRTPQCEAMF